MQIESTAPADWPRGRGGARPCDVRGHEASGARAGPGECVSVNVCGASHLKLTHCTFPLSARSLAGAIGHHPL